MAQAAPLAPARLTVQDMAQLLVASKKDRLPKSNLSQCDGDPIQWHEWFGQFKSAINFATFSDDVKLT